MINNCVICRNDFDGVGNNPHPVSLYGQCCKSCDDKKVIPARMLQLHYEIAKLKSLLNYLNLVTCLTD